MAEIKVRVATKRDTEAILAIYAPYVKTTAITFEYEVPAAEEFAARIRRVLRKYPYLVAMENEEVVGFAYAGAFGERAAYDWAVETSIYVKMDKKRLGIGKKLYKALELSLGEQGVLNANACIAYPEQEDEYLTKDSVAFHENLGYRLVGRFHQCGYKFNRWYHMAWMEKHIGAHKENQPPVKKFAQIRSHMAKVYKNMI